MLLHVEIDLDSSNMKFLYCMTLLAALLSVSSAIAGPDIRSKIVWDDQTSLSTCISFAQRRCGEYFNSQCAESSEPNLRVFTAEFPSDTFTISCRMTSPDRQLVVIIVGATSKPVNIIRVSDLVDYIQGDFFKNMP